jgi:hypothetical protein
MGLLAREMSRESNGRWQRFNSPDWSFIIAALLGALFLCAVLRPAWSPGSFVHTAGPGSDGQFNYRLALYPFTHQPLDYGIQFDHPAARQQRIIYPLVSWLAAFGSPIFVPALLIFVNYFALCLLGWLGGTIAQTLKRHALWGVLLPLYPGCLIALSCDSVEILELCLLLASLVALRRQCHVCATLLLTLALLTKETALLAVIAAACVYGAARQRGREPSVKWFYFTVPLAVFVLWQALLFYIWRTLAVAHDQREIGLPFVGFIRLLVKALRGQTPMPTGTLIELLLIAGFALLVLVQLRTTVASLFERAAWVLFAVWAFALNSNVWNTDWNFWRALAEVYLLGALIIIGGRRAHRFVLGASIIGLWFWQAYRLIVYLT